MLQVIVADIFGKTEALHNFATALSDNVKIIDPYHAEIMHFKDETEAYAYFSDKVGLAAYAEYVLKQLLLITDPVALIGFSVGASAIWQLSDNKALNHVQTATCFYSSQIRYHLDVQPLFPIKLIFPVQEPHFSVAAVISQLATTANVHIQQVDYLHGFMNSHSQNYDPSVYQYFLRLLAQ